MKFNQTVFGINPSDYLVKPGIALEQKRKEEKEREAAYKGDENFGRSNVGAGTGYNGYNSGAGLGDGTRTEAGTGIGADNANQATPTVQNKHFYMSAKLDNTRVNRDINNLVSEVIQHLMAVDGANVELKLEVEVEAENGIPSTTVRTVSENCRTLKVTDFGFDN